MTPIAATIVRHGREMYRGGYKLGLFHAEAILVAIRYGNMTAAEGLAKLDELAKKNVADWPEPIQVPA